MVISGIVTGFDRSVSEHSCKLHICHVMIEYFYLENYLLYHDTDFNYVALALFSSGLLTSPFYATVQIHIFYSTPLFSVQKSTIVESTSFYSGEVRSALHMHLTLIYFGLL